MIRVVLAVVVGVALLAAALPAVEHARADRAEASLARFTERLGDAGRAVATQTPVPLGVRGATRPVALPDTPRSLVAAPLTRLRVRCAGPRGFAVSASVAGHRLRRVVTLPARTAVRDPVTGTTDRHVRLAFRLLDGNPTVTASAPGDSSRETGPSTACSDSETTPTRRPAGAGPR